MKLIFQHSRSTSKPWMQWHLKLDTDIRYRYKNIRYRTSDNIKIRYRYKNMVTSQKGQAWKIFVETTPKKDSLTSLFDG